MIEFFTIFLLSGLISFCWMNKKYDEMESEVPTLSYIQKEVVLFAIFIMGMVLIIPILKNIWLDYRIKRTTKRIEELNKSINKTIKEINGKH